MSSRTTASPSAARTTPSTWRARPCFVDSVNFDDEESLNWFHRTLRDRGIIQALRDKGAGEGSTVSIGDMEFDFIE